jgi:hypothetical protein
MRSPAVAGQFYSGTASGLNRQLDEAFDNLTIEELQVMGAVVPHAGYMYSGGVAAEVFARLPKRDTYVLIGPNHTGLGLPVAMSREAWKTPLGTVEPDLEMADALSGSIIDSDEAAHLHEHSIEVQLPFLQRRFSSFKMLAIAMGLQDEETAVEVGSAVADAVRKLGRDCTVIASSDLTHYESAEVARKVDSKLIEAAVEMNVSKLYSQVYKYNATACGYGPIAATITASKALGATSGKLLRYATSGDVAGDYSQVVGYGAIIYT